MSRHKLDNKIRKKCNDIFIMVGSRRRRSSNNKKGKAVPGKKNCLQESEMNVFIDYNQIFKEERKNIKAPIQKKKLKTHQIDKQINSPYNLLKSFN